MNLIVVSGHMGKDAEYRTVNIGGENKGVCEFSLASKWGQQTDWHDIVCWGKQAEFTQNLKKGSKIVVQGYIKTETFKNDKGTVKTYKITAQNIEVLTAAQPKAEAQAAFDEANKKVNPNDVNCPF